MPEIQFDAVTERIKERSLLPPEDPKYLSRDDAKVAIKNYLGSKAAPTEAAPAEQQEQGPLDRWGQMLSNIAPSAKGVYRDYVAQPLSAPFETLGNMGKLPIGLYNKVAPQGMQIPGQGEAEAAVDQYGQRLSDRFGSLQKAEQTLVNDPVGAIAEVGMLAQGGRGVARAAKTGAKTGVAAVAENLPKSVAKKADAWSDMLYRSAVSPPNKQSLSDFNVKKGLKYGKDNKIIPSMESLEQSKADASALSKKTAAAFSNGVATPVRYNLKESFSDLASYIEQHKNSLDHIAGAKAAMGRFTNPTPALRKEMGVSSKATPQEISAAIKRGDISITTETAQTIKKDIYDKHGSRPWNDPDTLPLKTAAEKKIASGLRKSVAKRHDELKGMLEEESGLYAWQDVASQKILRDARNPWWSLAKKVSVAGGATLGGGALGGVPGAAAGLAIDLATTPAFKARTSFFLDKLANGGIKADRAAVQKLMEANADKIPMFSKLPPEASPEEFARAAAEQAKWKAEKGQNQVLADALAEINRRELARLASEKESLTSAVAQTPSQLEGLSQESLMNTRPRVPINTPPTPLPPDIMPGANTPRVPTQRPPAEPASPPIDRRVNSPRREMIRQAIERDPARRGEFLNMTDETLQQYLESPASVRPEAALIERMKSRATQPIKGQKAEPPEVAPAYKAWRDKTMMMDLKQLKSMADRLDRNNVLEDMWDAKTPATKKRADLLAFFDEMYKESPTDFMEYFRIKQ